METPGKNIGQTPDGEAIYRTERPADAKIQLWARQYKDGLVAEAIADGQGFEATRKIEEMTLAEVKALAGIVDFPTSPKDEAQEKKVG